MRLELFVLLQHPDLAGMAIRRSSAPRHQPESHAGVPRHAMHTGHFYLAGNCRSKHEPS
jgi:hypothetical protein